MRLRRHERAVGDAVPPPFHRKLRANRRMQTALPPVLIQGETGTGKTTIAVRPSVLIAEVRELERHREVLRPHGGDHRLQVVTALAGHTDLLFLNLRRHLEL